MSLDVDITRVVSETLAKLTVIWDEIGSSQEDRRAYVDQMAQDVLSVYENYYDKAIIHCDRLKQQIKDQTEHLHNLGEELGENATFVLPEGTLNVQITFVNERVDELEQTRAERAVHLEALVEQLRHTQSQLGIELEYTYLKHKESAVNDDENTVDPHSNVSLDHTSDFSLRHISEVEECLNKAQAECHRREKEVAVLEGDLTELLAELGCSEEPLVQAHKLHQPAIDQLRERVSSLFKLRAKRQEDIAILAEKITLLWDKLGVNSAVREAWVLQNNGKITDSVVRACETELDRLQILYTAHIDQAIDEAKMRLHILWDELNIPQVDRIMPELSGLDGEETLQKIVSHKSLLESHLAVIRPLIELINEREALHAEKADFEEKASNPNRLLSKKTKRDPGWLLKEEQIRKSFTTKLPKLDTILRKSLLEYQQNHHTPFMYNGEPYLDRMLTQEEKEKRKKEEEKSRKDKEKAQQLEKELLYGSTVPAPTVKTPGKRIANPHTPFTPKAALNSSVLQNSKRKRPALSPISTNILGTADMMTPQYSPKKISHTLNASLLDTSTRLQFDENDN